MHSGEKRPETKVAVACGIDQSVKRYDISEAFFYELRQSAAKQDPDQKMVMESSIGDAATMFIMKLMHPPVMW